VLEAFPQANRLLKSFVVKNPRGTTYSYISWSWKSLSSPLFFLQETLSGSTCKKIILEDPLHTREKFKLNLSLLMFEQIDNTLFFYNDRIKVG